MFDSKKAVQARHRSIVLREHSLLDDAASKTCKIPLWLWSSTESVLLGGIGSGL